MSTDSPTQLTPAKRLTRGLTNTAAGPVDITRGTLGLVAQSVAATYGGLRQQYRKSKARKELRKEVAAAQELVGREFAEVKDAVQVAVHTLPQSFSDTGTELRKSRRKGLVIAGAGLLLVAGGAAAFAKARASRQPEPSALPPSVDIAPSP